MRRALIRPLVLATLLPIGLAACGVKGDPRPPKGEEALYRLGDRQYPAPETVVPAQGDPSE